MESYSELGCGETVYVDTFEEGQQSEITAVLRTCGGDVEYDPAARYRGEVRPRYRVSLPAGCRYTGLYSQMAPQTITLPGGAAMRKLCIYPRELSVHLAWLPGDSENSALWDGAQRKTQEI